MNRAAVMQPLSQTQDMLTKLLALLEAAMLTSLPRTSSLRASEQGEQAIEREVISSYQVAQSLGFNGDFRASEHLLRVHQ